ncbi:MAG: c-type cytochrome biogenesis protein CcmI [Thiotrichales bacterium]|jgi:cytochrome c-type biogenesis protein CcmH|nr:c-type cytochrome biogenesis protein CcmI [Thiotrichales bacterium]MBT3613250.1 c-type cytochrome biogenesis protein CcmI [Thiotrichales bacterium]MBT3752724.1 c-type cytochrome biogenesis protein CcmI [Thiotrichales bacterium]MBT3837045.1 c-type cytochrome biogenesis protein CcmI [Thiotrichales bacterium]MBT4152552.1 c-type cytochrome biogenesis protein CcmI [Thiotrichales bacterium]
MGDDMIFWVGSAAMIAIAMLFLLPPLLGRSRDVGIARKETNRVIFQQRIEELEVDLESGSIDSKQFGQAENDLKRELLADMEMADDVVAVNRASAGRMAALFTLLIIPIISYGIYAKIGEPAAIDLTIASSAQKQHSAEEQSKQNFEDAVSKLEEKLEQEPNNNKGWMMLAKSYEFMGRSSEVVGIYEKAIDKLSGNVEADLFVEYGKAQARESGSWVGSPLVQLERALDISPTNKDALWVAGNAYADLDKQQEAIGFWERLADTIPSDDVEVARIINEAAFGAQQKLGLEKRELIPQSVQVATAKVATPTASGGSAITLSIELDPAFANDVAPSDTLFIYAKAVGRRGPPLAAQRLTAADLPLTITLDDSMAVMPGNNISSVDEVLVGAKITKSGVAIGGSGNLVGEATVSTSSNSTVKIVINGFK